MEAFPFDASLGSVVLFEHVQSNALEDGEVLGGVSGSFTAKVFIEIHVQHPVQFVLNAPVLADDGVESFGVGLGMAVISLDLASTFR